ncbi:ABC transporter substrate-binding protein [Herminiimonas sp. CN]|uniref:substrate-binding periplasmic protein n=1 Tax=Herminiimonas sp. CN TaxID=1349818 RepID=UPI000473C1C7|nr:transporter substrate-binding domain-containing protein [Herminiimonas sp. CN]
MKFLSLRRTGLAISLSFAALSAAAPAHADLNKIRQAGILKVAVYNDFAPFSENNAGIDIDLAEALTKKLGLKMSLLPFPAGENLNDDLRNMVWKGHYLGYGPADLLMHVPVDRRLAADNDKVEIFAPYYRETVRLVRNGKAIPDFDNMDALSGKKIGVEKISISAMVLLGEQNGRFRDDIKIYPTPIEALQDLKAGKLDAVLANQSEIESVFKGDTSFPVSPVSFQRLPQKGWAVGMAVKKNEPELARLLQTATDELVASGEMAKIFAKYGVHVVTP